MGNYDGLDGFARWLRETERSVDAAGKTAVCDIPIPPENQQLTDQIEYGHDGIPPVPIIRQSCASHEDEWALDISNRLLSGIATGKFNFDDDVAATERLMKADVMKVAESMGAKEEAETIFRGYGDLFGDILDAEEGKGE